MNNLSELRRRLRDAGVRSLYAKPLSANDNSKNQVYLGPDFSVLNLLPLGPVRADDTNARILKAAVNLSWIMDEGELIPAPNAQVILYPQYPEVRMSGFLKNTRGGPSAIMNSRTPGRVLFLGVTDDGRVLAHVTDAASALAREFESVTDLNHIGIFVEIPIARHDPRRVLLAALREIHLRGWIRAQRLDATGRLLDCSSTNCGGLTLEAALGVRQNGISDPDFHGWEIKAHTVANLARADTSAAITLMTPEPTAGFYKSAGVEQFIRKFGYRDPARADRFNFGGRHVVCIRSAKTDLHLVLNGFDATKRRITDASGGISLLTRSGEAAATWQFADLMTHWNRKHALAAYVPMNHRVSSTKQYRYGRQIRLGEQTDFTLFLAAMASRQVYYDPGVKLEAASTARPLVKRRNQFRIASRDIGALYRTMTTIDLVP